MRNYICCISIFIVIYILLQETRGDNTSDIISKGFVTSSGSVEPFEANIGFNGFKSDLDRRQFESIIESISTLLEFRSLIFVVNSVRNHIFF